MGSCSALDIEPRRCLCECGQVTNFDNWHKRYNRFIFGHYNKAENNGKWKGDKIKSISALHDWIKRRYKKPDKCQYCNKETEFLDLANISPTYNPETYTRDLKNWIWLDRVCHMQTDHRIDRFYDPELQRKYGELGHRASATKKQELTK